MKHSLDCFCHSCDSYLAASSLGDIIQTSSAITEGRTSTPESSPKSTAALNCGFFTPTCFRTSVKKSSSMGMCRAEALNSVDGRFLGNDSGIPAQRPPFLHSTGNRGYRKLPKRAVVMPSIFVVRNDASLRELSLALSEQMITLQSLDDALFQLLEREQQGDADLYFSNQVQAIQHLQAQHLSTAGLIAERIEVLTLWGAK